jgi:hypothetical protein
MTIWSILRPLVYFIVIWYIFSRFGMMYQEKSGNPATKGLVASDGRKFVLCEQVEAERCSKLLGSTNDDSKLFRMV